MKSFNFLATIPENQSGIKLGEDSARVQLEVPFGAGLGNTSSVSQDQAVMILQQLRRQKAVLKVTIELESVGYQGRKKLTQEATKEVTQEVNREENREEKDYQSPEQIDQLKKLRQNIHLEIMNAGMELHKPAIIKTLTGYSKERECTIKELQTVWAFIIKDETLPITNHSRLRERLCDLIGASND